MMRRDLGTGNMRLVGLLLLCLLQHVLGQPTANGNKDGIQRRQGNDERMVFAHYIVGLTSGQTLDQWTADISQAQAASIDGFALNIGPNDPWTHEQLVLAYSAASEADFLLFISFDFAAGSWDVSYVVDLMNDFKDYSAQWYQDNMPVVSTFEGPDWVDNWASVRQQVAGGIWLCPDWTSLGAQGVATRRDKIEGAFSWEAWPLAGQTSKTTDSDRGYLNALEDKKYMMGVSPYFFTRLPQYNKNWYSSSETLWYDRWMQVLEIMPDIVQIISWNDFGESHYISDIIDRQIVSGAESYVQNHPHAAFRLTLPYFIAAYKAGTKNIIPPTGDVALAWYRKMPVSGRTAGGTVWGQGGSEPASSGASDVVSVLVIAEKPKVITLMLGDEKHNIEIVDTPVAFFELPMPSNGGQVILAMDGNPTEGPPIQLPLSASDPVDFNSVVISVPEI